MRFDRYLPRFVALLGMVAVFAVPGASWAHEQDHDAQLDAALASLPAETAAGTCRATELVEGLGESCRTEDGEFRVQLATGTTMTTHGTDAAPALDSRVVSAPFLPDSQAALDGASADDIECTEAPGDRRVELVYAYPADKPDRSATLADPMREELYAASAFIDAESQAFDEDKGRRLRVLCESDVPVVHTVAVRASGVDGGDYSTIVNDLVAAGFPAPAWNTTSTRRFMVFYDDRATNGSAGVGGMFVDETPGSTNLNNVGARYAVEFNWSVSGLPHWDVFLHEMGHNMGAVADGAPDSSQVGHCIDGLDIMCYDDDGPGGTYTSSVCAMERFDCGGDTYFNPSPPFGSWLSTHWNVASTNNHWLVPRDLGWDNGGVPDLDPPSVPTTPAVSAIATTSMTVSWGASVDARSNVKYRVGVDRSVDGSWQLYSTIVPVSATNVAVTGLESGVSYRFRVSAYDQADNFSAEVDVTAATLTGPPVAPGSIGLTVIDGDSISAAWTEGSAPGGLRGYDVELQRGTESWVRFGGETAALGTQFDGLTSGSWYRARVRSVSAGGVVSGWRSSAYVLTPGVLAGGDEVGDAEIPAPTVAVSIQSPVRALMAWTASPAAAAWTVSITDSRGATRTVDATTTARAFTDLSPNSTYAVSVVARSEDGLRESDPGSATFTTPRDTAAPGMSRFGAPRFVGTTLRISWSRATDNARVAKYQLQRRRGTRWIAVLVRPGAVSATVLNVRRGTSTVLRVRAIDVGGNPGRWASVTIRRR